MEYLVDRRVFTDLPLGTIFADFTELYGDALGAAPAEDAAFDRTEQRRRATYNEMCCMFTCETIRR